MVKPAPAFDSFSNESAMMVKPAPALDSFSDEPNMVKPAPVFDTNDSFSGE